jgi:type IV pilus assembly protein PilW
MCSPDPRRSPVPCRPGRPPPRRGQRGVGLIELLIGTAIAAMVGLAAFAGLLLSRSAAAGVADLGHLQQQASYALHLIGSHVRQAGVQDPVRDPVRGLHAFGEPLGLGETGAPLVGSQAKAGGQDTMAVVYAPWPGSDAASPSPAHWQYDCTGSRVDGSPRVEGRFEVNAQGQLTCAGLKQKQPVIGNVAEFRIDYRVDSGGGVRVLEAREVDGLGLWSAVRAVEVCLVLRGNERGPDLGSAYQGCNGKSKARQGHVHLVFRQVFGVRAAG